MGLIYGGGVRYAYRGMIQDFLLDFRGNLLCGDLEISHDTIKYFGETVCARFGNSFTRQCISSIATPVATDIIVSDYDRIATVDRAMEDYRQLITASRDSIITTIRNVCDASMPNSTMVPSPFCGLPWEFERTFLYTAASIHKAMQKLMGSSETRTVGILEYVKEALSHGVTDVMRVFGRDIDSLDRYCRAYFELVRKWKVPITSVPLLNIFLLSRDSPVNISNMWEDGHMAEMSSQYVCTAPSFGNSTETDLATDMSKYITDSIIKSIKDMSERAYLDILAAISPVRPAVLDNMSGVFPRMDTTPVHSNILIDRHTRILDRAMYGIDWGIDTPAGYVHKDAAKMIQFPLKGGGSK